MSDEFGFRIEESFSISEAQDIAGMFDLQSFHILFKFCTFGLERTNNSRSFQQFPLYVRSRKSPFCSILYHNITWRRVQMAEYHISLSAIGDCYSRPRLSCAVGCNPHIAGRLPQLRRDAL